MRTQGSITRIGAGGLGLLAVGVLAGYMLVSLGAAPAAGAKAAKPDPVALGKEIFHREWLPGDRRGHGGDGLGPVYNDTSCVACHNSGGAGGGGPNSKNIDILSASIGRAEPGGRQAADSLANVHAGFREGRTAVLHKFGTDPSYESWRRSLLQGSQIPTVIDTTLAEIPLPNHDRSPFNLPTATGAQAVVLPVLPEAPLAPPVPVTEVLPSPSAPHVVAETQPVRPSIQAELPPPAGTTVTVTATRVEPAPVASGGGQQRLQEARAAVLTALASAQPKQMVMGGIVVSRSQRNPTALFGLGLIDKIPAKAIEEAAARRDPRFPEIQGRVSRLKDGRIGRLGWKGQTAGVEDFVLTACAVELGLEVPGHHQAIIPQAPKYQVTGMDLTGDECSALVAYVASLPRPMERRAAAHDEVKAMTDGKALFASVGCASCHAPSLGGVDGIFSDLLLHDMGADLGDTGSYNGGSDDETLNPVLAADGKPATGTQPTASRPATRQEWRTPPLWGFRDSGPYLHDGRAETLDQAVSMHGGQGAASAQRYFELSPSQRRQIEMFLKSLVAPVEGDGQDH